MSEKIALSHEDQEKLVDLGCRFERSSVTRDQILSSCGKSLDTLIAELQAKQASAWLLASLKAEVKPATWASGTWDTPVGDEKKDADKAKPPEAPKKPKEDIEDLPLAPTTAFNVMRLVQLGYFPKDYAPIFGEKPWWPHKILQGFYVIPGKWGESIRASANTAFQKKFDRDAAYKGFMLDLVKQMDSELKSWISQNDHAKTAEAKTILETMRADFTAGNTKEWLAKFDTLTEKLGMRLSPDWTRAAVAERDLIRDGENAKTTQAQERLDLRNRIKTDRIGQKSARETSHKNAQDAVTNLKNTNPHSGIEERFYADTITTKDIDTEKARLEAEKLKLADHTWALRSESQSLKYAIAGRAIADITADRNRVGYEIKPDTYWVWSELEKKQNEIVSKKSEIEWYNKPGGQIESAQSDLDKADLRAKTLQTDLATKNSQLTTLQISLASATKTAKPGINAQINALQTEIGTLNGNITTAESDVAAKKTALSTKRWDLYSKEQELTKLEWEKKSLVTQSEQNKFAFDWYTTRTDRMAHIDTQIALLDRLKPLTETRNTAAQKLKRTEQSISKSDAAITKREQALRDAHAKSTPILDALDKVVSPTASAAEKKVASDHLNDLLAQKDLRAVDIETLLKWNEAQKREWMKQLTELIDGKVALISKEWVRLQMNAIADKIKAHQVEAARIIAEYDAKAPTWDVEQLKKQLEADIGKINADIEKLNKEARTTYGAASDVLNKLDMESIKKTPLWWFLWGLNTWVSKIESLEATKVWSGAMRGIYGAMTLAWLGQIGVTTAKSGWKQGALDATDMGIGFIPVAWWVYDLSVWLMQFVKWSELVSFEDKAREVSKTDALKRMGFWVLGLIPIAGQALKAAAKWEKILEVTRKVAVAERTAQVTGKLLLLNEAKNLGVWLYDASMSTVSVKGGILETWKTLLNNQTLPVNKIHQ